MDSILVNWNIRPWNEQVLAYVISFILTFNLAYSTNIFYFYLDYYGIYKWNIVRKWKLQSGNIIPKRELINIHCRCIAIELLQGLTVGPILWYVYSIFGLNYDFRTLPRLEEIARTILFLMFWDDTVTYWVHRLLHQPYLYQKIHKRHHEFIYPVGPTFLLTHGLENIMMNMPAVAGGTVAVLAMGYPMHYMTYLIWVLIRVNEAIVRHSGYYFPWSPPPMLFPGAPFHDYHHSHNKGAYGSFLCLWDRVMGTDNSFWRYWYTKKDKTSGLEYPKCYFVQAPVAADAYGDIIGTAHQVSARYTEDDQVELNRSKDNRIIANETESGDSYMEDDFEHVESDKKTI